MSAVVFGGYGVFGSIVVRTLVAAGHPVAIAGRNLDRARALAAELGPLATAVEADAHDRASCASALQGRTVAVNCSGPFRAADAALLDVCLAAGVHYADIADERTYCAHVRELGPRFRERGLTAAWGLSSLPGISGALAVALAKTAPPISARVTLFIGNRNPKGRAAIRSALGMIGRPIAAPQGTLLGFCDPVTVPLPPPFGPRTVRNADSPDYDVLPALLGVPGLEVTVKVGFELRTSNQLFGAMARFGPIWGDVAARFLGAAGALMGGLGLSGGAVMVELVRADGSTIVGSASGAEGAQRMAAQPCAFIVGRLLAGQEVARGAVAAYEAVPARAILDDLAAAGFEIRLGSAGALGAAGRAGSVGTP